MELRVKTGPGPMYHPRVCGGLTSAEGLGPILRDEAAKDGVFELFCGELLGVEVRVDGLGEDVAGGGGGLIDAEERGEGGGEVYGFDATVVGAGDEGGAEEAERHVAIVGVRGE